MAHERQPRQDPGPDPRRMEEDFRELSEKATLAQAYLDLARRTKADFINYQDRIQREREDWAQGGMQDLVRELLPALDCLTGMHVEDPAVRAGLHLVEKEFIRVLSRHQIHPIPTSGRRFNPLYHDAVETEETCEFEPGTILEQIRRGWMWKDRVLRPASVRVVRSPAAKPSGSMVDRGRPKSREGEPARPRKA